MIIEKELKKLFHELNGQQKSISFDYEGTSLTMSVFNNGSQFDLSALVYEGGNYIPTSVRRCVLEAEFPSSIKTDLKIDEGLFQITLYHTSPFHHLNDIKFQNTLEEFSHLVSKWRLILDENDRNDLVHVRVK